MAGSVLPDASLPDPTAPLTPSGNLSRRLIVSRLTRIVAWYDKYLKSAATSSAPQP